MAQPLQLQSSLHGYWKKSETSTEEQPQALRPWQGPIATIQGIQGGDNHHTQQKPSSVGAPLPAPWAPNLPPVGW